MIQKNCSERSKAFLSYNEFFQAIKNIFFVKINNIKFINKISYKITNIETKSTKLNKLWPDNITKTYNYPDFFIKKKYPESDRV